MTLGCLAPYRRHGIGTKMVEHVEKIVEKDGKFTSVFLHVQVCETCISSAATLHSIYVGPSFRYACISSLLPNLYSCIPSTLIITLF